MGEWVIGTTIGDLKGLSLGSIPPFPTKNQGFVARDCEFEGQAASTKQIGRKYGEDLAPTT